MNMKKMMIAALMLLGTSTAFAGDSDQLKAILGMKSYEQAEQKLKENLASLPNAEEKAKAYNHLVTLAMAQYDAQSTIQLENQTAKQMGGKGDKPVDLNKLYDGAYKALLNAVECNKYDQMPNAKGKVKPRYAGNAQNIWNARVQLVNAGQDASQAQKNDDVLKFWGLFVATDEDPLFNGIDPKNRESEKAYFGQVARFAGIYAFQAKDYAAASKYAQIAMKDPKEYKEALNLALSCEQVQLKTKEDSVKFAEHVKGFYEKDPKSDILFGTLVSTYNQMGMTTELNALLDAKEKEDPNNFYVYAVRGQNAMLAQDLDKAIEAYRKAVEIQPENAQIIAYLGACLFDKAQKAEERAAGKTGRLPQAARAQIEPVFKEAEQFLEKAKQLDPDQAKSSWRYALYRVYYRLYGAQDARTVEAQKEAGV